MSQQSPDENRQQYITPNYGIRQAGVSCPKCGYRLSNFKSNSQRCFNCDYKTRGSDGPWADGVSTKQLIYQAEEKWDCSAPLSADDHKHTDVYEYLKVRGIYDLALKCDQLRTAYPWRTIRMRRSGQLLVARIWHVRKGFVGVHLTRCEWTGGDPNYARDERQTHGACQGGAVWFGTVTPSTELVVGEGIETVLSAMKLWNAKAGAATLGTAGLEYLVLPQATRHVVIAADNDEPEPPHRIGAGLRTAYAARRAWQTEDPRVSVRIKSPIGVKDWNDVLMKYGA